MRLLLRSQCSHGLWRSVFPLQQFPQKPNGQDPHTQKNLGEDTMTNRKSTKRALLGSIMAMVLCLAMLVGATFAWFTDTASTDVNKIQAGKLDVALEMKDAAGQWVSAEGKTLDFVKAAAGEQVLWEPGCTYTLPELRVVNNGNLALKYKIQITGIQGDAKLNEVINWTINDAAIDLTEGHLTAGQQGDAFTIKGHMQESAGNEYQGLSIDGIGITVYATQYTYESDSFGKTYDADAGKDTAFYTLAEFNALTEIPEGVKVAYVNLNGASLEGGLTIGNTNIADHYAYTDWNSDVAPDGYPTKVGTDKRASDGATRYIYSTGKPAADIILTGSVTGAKDTGGFNAGSITLKVPDAANVTFEKVNFGAGQMAMSMWTEPNVASMTVPHRVASVTFDSCTFNGNWIQNGAFGADEMVVKNCTFNKYENTAGINSDGFDNKNNSNPIWIQNLGQCNVTIEGCTINAVRPIKLWEGTASGSVTIKNNTFNMSKCSIDTADTHKNIGVMFCQSTLDNVVVSGNTVKGDATALICFYNKTTCPTMNDGATFKLAGNTLNGVKESVLWKTATEWTPDYVNQ